MFGDYRSSTVAITSLGLTLLLLTALRVLQLHKQYPAPGPRVLLAAVGRVVYAIVATFMIGYLANRVLVLLGCMLGLLLSLKCWDMLLVSPASSCSCQACVARRASLEQSNSALPNTDECEFGLFQHQFHSHLGALLYVPEDKLRELHAGVKSILQTSSVNSATSHLGEYRIHTVETPRATPLPPKPDKLESQSTSKRSSLRLSSERSSSLSSKSRSSKVEMSGAAVDLLVDRHAVELAKEELGGFEACGGVVAVEESAVGGEREESSDLMHVESRESVWRRRQMEMDEDEELDEEEEDEEEDESEDDSDVCTLSVSFDTSDGCSPSRGTHDTLS
eukprot:TRINITY_DN5266_c0_g1_i12.p1 TRINITY_DN5266_c0_g1~~TRINITY_DN5266_c0_g1_i12.p1  ORF type:complete len:335 (-),score=71.41 TRINITY_DN5266_c0_g1_i12:238-1242(-)